MRLENLAQTTFVVVGWLCNSDAIQIDAILLPDRASAFLQTALSDMLR